jgi:hypothetical protein
LPSPSRFTTPDRVHDDVYVNIDVDVLGAAVREAWKV